MKRVRRRALWIGGVAAVAVGLLAAPSAGARSVYATSLQGAALVRVVDSATNQVTGQIQSVAERGRDVVFTPDGTRAYVAVEDLDSVLVVDTRTNQVVGAPIPVGDRPTSLAITPGGGQVFAGSAQGLHVIDTASNQVVASKFGGSGEFDAVAFTPDGARAYVTSFISGTVAVLDAASGRALAAPIAVGESPVDIAITPDGSRAYVVLEKTNDVAVIDTVANRLVGAPIDVDTVIQLDSVAITPNGARAYVADTGGEVYAIDTGSNRTLEPEVSLGGGLGVLAVTPDGSRVYASAPGGLAAIDTASNQILGAPIQIGAAASGVGIVPNQPPSAALAPATLKARPGVSLTLDASPSRDSDGTIATYGWAFGDGQSASVTSPTATHAFAKPGTYTAALTLTDNEGCSTALVFTGKSVSCNGSARAASATRTIEVAFPGVRVRCPKAAKPRGCAYKLQVVAGKAKGKRKPKAQSAVARAKLKPGRSAIVSLKAKPAFRAKLAAVRSVLVKETKAIAGKTTTRYRKLKIVQ